MIDTVLITGSNRGIGLEFTKQYLERGCKVFATCREPEKANSLQLLLSEYNDLSVLELDVGSQASVDAIKNVLSGLSIDLLINNAAVTGGGRQDFREIDCNEWLQTLSINVLGPMRVSFALLENLEKGASPKIISISSEVASMVHHSRSFYAYSSSKAALNKAMQHLATSLEECKIIVGLMHPGWVRTDMGGENADITAEESVKGMMMVIDSLSMKDTGKFLTWQGDEHAW